MNPQKPTLKAPYRLIAFLLLTPCCAEEKSDFQIARETYANAILDRMSKDNQRPKWATPEWEPHYADHQKMLQGMGQAGWDMTFERFKEGRIVIIAARDVIGRIPERQNADRDTKRLLSLLKDTTFRRRTWVPQLIKMRAPERANEFLEPFLEQQDTELLRACVGGMNFRNPSPQNIESIIALLDHEDSIIKFYSTRFLEFATGHICLKNGVYTNTKDSWKTWWNTVKDLNLNDILKAELFKLPELINHENRKVSERAGLILLTQSAHITYGKGEPIGEWWNAAEGAKHWKKWLTLRYKDQSSLRLTSVEHHFREKRPTVPIEILRATISLNIGDLKSPNEKIRNNARYAISQLLEGDSPWQGPRGHRRSARFDELLTEWWQHRMAGKL